MPRWGAWTGLPAGKPLEESAASEPLRPENVLPLGKAQLGQGCGLPWRGRAERTKGWGRLQCMLPSTSVGSVWPLCCSLEGKESGPGSRSSKARQALRARACGFAPASVRVLGCGAGPWAQKRRLCLLPGTRRSLSTQVVASYWPAGRGTELPGRLYLSLKNRLVRPQALGPLGRGEARKIQQPEPTVHVAGEPRRPREAERNQLQMCRLCVGWGWWKVGAGP